MITGTSRLMVGSPALQRPSHGSSSADTGLVSAARQDEYTRVGVGRGSGSVAAPTAMIAAAPTHVSPAIAASPAARFTGRR
jgi:3'-phosphoadenosine 5'-phosphosulfate (PAPS) 3'-phosphatase